MRVILILTSRITSYAAGGFELLENAPGDFVLLWGHKRNPWAVDHIPSWYLSPLVSLYTANIQQSRTVKCSEAWRKFEVYEQIMP